MATGAFPIMPYQIRRSGAHGLPPFLREAGGKMSGHQDNASDGLVKQTDSGGRTWAYNPLMQQWQIVHTLVSGNTLWGLSAKYYGTSSTTGTHAIRDVPQNLPIVGQSGADAFAGDVILIPNLSDPWSGAPPGAVPQNVGPSSMQLPAGWPATTPDWWPAGVPYPPQLTSTAPAGWPPGVTWPPFGTTPTSTSPATGGDIMNLPNPLATNGNGQTVPASSTTTDATTTSTTSKPWSTGTKVAVGVGAVVVLGLATWGIVAATKKPKRRRR